MTTESKIDSPAPIKQKITFKGDNSDYYTWNRNDKQLLQNILNATNKQSFESDPFIMAKLKWTLKLFPNGNTDINKGNVKIFLKLVSMPCELERIVLSASMLCNNTMSSASSITTYSKSEQDNGWPDKVLLLSEWRSMNLNNISITVVVQIHHIILNDSSNYLKLSNFTQLNKQNEFLLNQHNKIMMTGNNHPIYTNKSQFVHRINGRRMVLVKKAYNGKQFESEIFDNMWRLSYYPNGSNENCSNYFSVYLRLCALPLFISKINAKWSIICNETQELCGHTRVFGYDKQGSGKGTFMRFSDINSLQEMTFTIDIEIINVEFVTGNDKNMNQVYDGMQIENILSVIQKQSMVGVNERLDYLTMNIKENNIMMKQMQNNMNEVVKQINDLRLSINEEKKNDDMDDLREQIKSMTVTINTMVNEEDNKKQNAMKQWLRNIVELPQYIDLFIENGIDDMETVKHITMNELTMIGMDKIGHKIKIIKEIAKLNQEDQPPMVHEGGTAYI